MAARMETQALQRKGGQRKASCCLSGQARLPLRAHCVTVEYMSKNMNGLTPTISIRLPVATRRSLDRAAKTTRRSRSFLMKEALDRHLADIVRDESAQPRKPLAHLLSMAGAGAGLAEPRPAAEIDAQIRWLRDDD